MDAHAEGPRAVTPAAAAMILRRQGMPPEEIADVLDDDAVLARRRLELHRERLREWLRTQDELIASIERSIVGTAERLGRTAS
jgi:DNA-binding transcriptional MerR regulator